MKATQHRLAILFAGFATASSLRAGVMATGGVVTNYVEGAFSCQAHLFKDVGTSSLNVSAGGVVEVLVVAGGGASRWWRTHSAIKGR